MVITVCSLAETDPCVEEQDLPEHGWILIDRYNLPQASGVRPVSRMSCPSFSRGLEMIESSAGRVGSDRRQQHPFSIHSPATPDQICGISA